MEGICLKVRAALQNHKATECNQPPLFFSEATAQIGVRLESSELQTRAYRGLHTSGPCPGHCCQTLGHSFQSYEYLMTGISTLAEEEEFQGGSRTAWLSLALWTAAGNEAASGMAAAAQSSCSAFPTPKECGVDKGTKTPVWAKTGQERKP